MQKAIETNNGLKGGLLKGKAHYDSNGNPLGGIKAIVTDQGGKPIEVEGNEVIINKKTVQSDKVLTVKGTPKEILSTLNQMDGNGVAIGDEEAEILAKYRNGGELIKRADGSYSRRGLYDNIRDNIGSGRKPTKQMLEQEAKIKEKYSLGGKINEYSVNEFEKYLEDKYNANIDLGDYKKYIYLSKISIPKEIRGLGIGTEIMNEIIAYADENNRLVTLTSSTDYGATSISRLKEFYKNFGFIENKGRNKNFEISQSMYRVPVNEKYHLGGSISKMTPSELKAFYDTPEGKKLDAQTYSEWKRLVNMTKSELKDFYNSEEGKKAGLTTSQAKEQGIDSGRESARWIMKMKDIPYKEWSSDMWRWAKKQINFIKRMSGMKGRLYDEKGNKTRKHTALLIWGHNPELTKALRRFRGGGELSQKALNVETNDLTDFVRKYFIKDGRIDVSDAMQELFGNKKGKSIADEYRKRIGLHKKGGLTISQLAHNLWEEHKDEVREGIDDSDFRNAVEEVLISEYGVSSMINSLIEKSSESEEDKENEYWMRRYGEDEDYYDDYYEDLTDEEVADYFRDMEGFERELAKGTEHEMEHLDTLKKVAEGKLTPEQAVVETAKTHIKENPNYYEDLQKMELEDLKDKLKNQGYNVTIPSGGNRISVMGYGKGYFNAKKQKADSILSSLKRNGYNAVSKLDADGYYDFWVYSNEPKQDLANMESENDLAIKNKPKVDALYIINKKLKEEGSDPNDLDDINDAILVNRPNDMPIGYEAELISKYRETGMNIEIWRIKTPKNNFLNYKIYPFQFDYKIGTVFKNEKTKSENEESIPDLIEGLKVLADSLEGAEKKEIEDVIEGLEILLESDNKFAEDDSVGSVLWATKIGEPDYNEQLITENSSQIENAKKWALANGFDRLRVSTIDNSKPDFTKGFKKYAEGGEFKMATGGKIVFKPITTPL